jgi:hypothetical protein
VKLPLPSRWVWRAAALTALVLVFAAYLRPDMLFTLATAVWNCF